MEILATYRHQICNIMPPTILLNQSMNYKLKDATSHPMSEVFYGSTQSVLSIEGIYGLGWPPIN